MLLCNDTVYELCDIQQQIMDETGIDDISNETELLKALQGRLGLQLESVSDKALKDNAAPICLLIVEYRRLCKVVRKIGIY